MHGPKMFRIRQRLDTTRPASLTALLEMEFAGIRDRLPPLSGAEVAITAGSRGIANLAVIVRGVVDQVRRLGGSPFVFPAMGSHGGGTAEGQAAVLRELGVTEGSVGAPIRATMDVVQIGRTAGGVNLWLDRYAYEAGRIVVVNRIKPHTDFSGEVESGLLKMMLIGLGKQRGADYYHKVFVDRGYDTVILEAARAIIQDGRILFGVGIVENGVEDTSLVRYALPREIEATERELLLRARAMFPTIPLDAIDVLIVDEMGKEISGAGMDPNVTGRVVTGFGKHVPRPRVRRLYVRDLTEASHGNAAGIGTADFTRRSLVQKIDHQATALNCITSCTPEEGRIPIALDTDREALAACFSAIHEVDEGDVKLVHVKNTLTLDEFYASEALLEEVRRNDRLEVCGEGAALRFRPDGNLISPFEGAP